MPVRNVLTCNVLWFCGRDRISELPGDIDPRPPFPVVILSQLNLCAIVSVSLCYPGRLWGIENFLRQTRQCFWTSRTCVVTGRRAQIPGATSSGQLNFLRWRLICVGRRYGTCVMLISWRRFGLMSVSWVKVKQFHYRPWESLKIPGGWVYQISKQSAPEGGKFVSLTHRPPLPWYLILLEAESILGP